MQYYSVMTLFACLSVVALMIQAAANNVLSKRVKRDIIISSLMIVTATSCEYLGVRLNGGDPSLRGLHRSAKFLELSIAPAIPVVFGAGVYPVRRMRWLVIPLIAHMLMEFVSMFVGITYYVDAQNVYVHCRFYILYCLAYGMGVLFLINRVTKFTHFYQNRNRFSLIFIMSYVLLGVVLQAIDKSIRIVWLSVCIGVNLFYNYYCNLLQVVDPLTKILNRRSFETRMDDRHLCGVLIVADVNDFKSVNDRFGHCYGDRCLAEIAAALKEVYGKYGRCYRIGGDEFAVMLKRVPESMEALNALLDERVRARQRLDPEFPGVSVGYARIDADHLSPDEAMEWADQMMYGHKERRKHG